MESKPGPNSTKTTYAVYGVVQLQIKKFDVPQDKTNNDKDIPTSSSSKNPSDEDEFTKNKREVLSIINKPHTGTTSNLLRLNSRLNYLSKLKGYTYSIPFILRSANYYCPAEIFESLLLGDVLKNINCAMYKERIPAVRAQKGEVKALSQYLLWRKIVKPNDCKVLVDLEDVKQFYRYIEYCLKIHREDCDDTDCGFLRINNVHVVPYVLRDEDYFVSAYFLDEKRFELRNDVIILTEKECLYMRAHFIIMNKQSHLDEVAFAVNVKDLDKIFDNVITEVYMPPEVKNFNMWDNAYAKDYKRLSWCDLKKLNSEVEVQKRVTISNDNVKVYD